MSQQAMEVQFREFKDTITQLNNTIQIMTEMLSEKDSQIAEMAEEIRQLRKHMYGSKKERTAFDYDNSPQINMLAELGLRPEPEKEPELIEAEYIEVKSYKKEKKKKPTLEEKFSDLPVKQVVVDNLADEDKQCPVCGTEMKPIGTEVIRREVIHVKPSMYMIEYIATTYACPKCKDTEDPQFIKDDKAPEALIPGSYASPSLAAWAFYQKFALSVPFYRLEKSFAELGAEISRSTMAHWAVMCDQRYFKPLTDYFHRELLKRKFLMMDETPIQVLKEPDRRPESKSYVWLMRSGDDGLDPIVYYHYAPSRSGDVAVDLLKGINEGTYLMADGFSGYNKVKDIHRCTCYAHIRRYFYEAIPKGHGNDITCPAVQGVMYCNKLFSLENKYAACHYKYDTRKKKRLEEAEPVIDAFLAWAEKQCTTGNGKFSKAVNYLLNRKDYLKTYLEDGHCSLSNNWSENSVRPITIGRKNWLFSQSVDGANASMHIYTLVEMAKLYGLSRYKYIEYLLEHRPDADMRDDELSELAPWNEKVKEACAKCDR